MKIGDIAPDFELESNTGDKVKLSTFFEKKKVILFFYVKNNTPGCNSEVDGMKNHYSKISDR